MRQFTSYHYLLFTELLVESATIVSHQGVGLDVLYVGPGALIHFITFFVVHFHLQHKKEQHVVALEQMLPVSVCCRIYTEPYKLNGFSNLCLSVCLVRGVHDGNNKYFWLTGGDIRLQIQKQYMFSNRWLISKKIWSSIYILLISTVFIQNCFSF